MSQEIPASISEIATTTIVSTDTLSFQDNCHWLTDGAKPDHFHFGYFVYTAAVIGYLDPGWLTTGTNKAWVNMLVRDYANPVTTDPYFPFSRSFDWYQGHSWASGLFEALDGRNQESSSEDTMSTYALKMWGQITGDVNMEARGNLMLAIQARSIQSYYLTTDDNTAPREVCSITKSIIRLTLAMSRSMFRASICSRSCRSARTFALRHWLHRSGRITSNTRLRLS
jgi:endoglucanase Acf2